MTQPTDHYAEAERHLERSYESGRGTGFQERMIARAHVHALLAATKPPQVPIVVKAPEELLAKMRYLDLEIGGGILLIPEEIAAGYGEGDPEAGVDAFVKQLIEAMERPMGGGLA